ncbi:Endoplasmic reticulum-Golgi intermediate compartment protein 3 [Wickerhamomyces ciferrii]|uniref:Endoplasmic reticulum-Golgi intermediate compartment protein n=1 Tax=Wickerhamomyces ciferrii (strain ATCC 14091 / BCRC 22168 / CBS 111 / JCM 3599 / NBRC 0793 / NRRL Y-1031 F-60-10) TaxID=1206466 RepID=K0KJ99_WICCF|nr:Endoplasmic reticulum-Golgi intermediate compartment protein 3 [Wickerhamomyces ciferrii]CCH42207.1 Endoplasmic reticulum-Golgi intermediate compartment protein 3 [Wickerhamomyces ciferrii]
MAKKGGLLSFDAFSKTVEDARVKTTSGGLITVTCILTLFSLIINEWRQFNEITIDPELVVDRDRNLKLDINLDVTFPDLPCDIMSLDIMDVSGDLQLDVTNYGFTKIRLTETGEEIGEEEMKIGDDHGHADADIPADYCGPCYGAKNQDKNENKPQEEKVCCNDCDSVRKAYASVGWAFFDGKNVEQCEREGYVKKINDRLGEGCRVKGTAKLNRINGNIHFAPGASYSAPNRHVHDLSLYGKNKDFNFRHVINHFSFGPDVNSKYTAETLELSSHPLDGTNAIQGSRDHLYSYFLKVVPTRYEYLNGTKVETNQFSSTYHDRPLTGGRDEDHPNTFHARGGIPGLFFHFEMSPLKIINKETYGTSWSGFLLNVISAIGGILTVGAVVDRTVFVADKVIRRKKDK